MQIQPFFDEKTHTFTYVIYERESSDAIVIDPVLDYDPETGKTLQHGLSKVTDFISEKGLVLHLILESHAHADHLTGSPALKATYSKAKIGIGEGILEVQKQMGKMDGSKFDLLLKDNQELRAGKLHLRVLATPGHTPACVSYLLGNALFTGDALLMPDSGTGRCDFPGGSATELFHSIKRLFTLPEETRVFVGHDYSPQGREALCETTIGQSKRKNIHLNETTDLETYVTFREARDMTLPPPRLMGPSLKFNV